MNCARFHFCSERLSIWHSHRNLREQGPRKDAQGPRKDRTRTTQGRAQGPRKARARNYTRKDRARTRRIVVLKDIVLVSILMLVLVLVLILVLAQVLALVLVLLVVLLRSMDEILHHLTWVTCRKWEENGMEWNARWDENATPRTRTGPPPVWIIVWKHPEDMDPHLFE
jgi:hypothetical protein